MGSRCWRYQPVLALPAGAGVTSRVPQHAAWVEQSLRNPFVFWGAHRRVDGLLAMRPALYLLLFFVYVLWLERLDRQPHRYLRRYDFRRYGRRGNYLKEW